MEKIGLLGGTFNPVQKDHINLVKSAIKSLKLNKLIVMPTFVSPHKIGSEVAPTSDRLNMLEIAFSGIAGVEISDYEIKKGGVSYSFETVTYLKNLYNPSELYFILGSDMLEDFKTWKNPQVIADNAILALAKRKDYVYDNNYLIESVKEQFNAKIVEIEGFNGTNVSSSLIRSYLKLGLNLQNFTSKEVEDYIRKNGLYKGDKYYEFAIKNLPEKRLIHTAGVIVTALKFCKDAGVDAKKADLAALLHDVAKYLDYKNYKDFILPKDCVYNVIHQFLGAYVIEKELKITDKDVINAVKYHTTGRKNMSQLEKLIFVADLIEQNRSFSGVDELRLKVDKDFESGFRLCISEIYKFLLKKGEEIYYLTQDAFEYYKEN